MCIELKITVKSARNRNSTLWSHYPYIIKYELITNSSIYFNQSLVIYNNNNDNIYSVQFDYFSM